jgi:hypothetical protein
MLRKKQDTGLQNVFGGAGNISGEGLEKIK